jgi:hypothetical protein
MVKRKVPSLSGVVFDKWVYVDFAFETHPASVELQESDTPRP